MRKNIIDHDDTSRPLLGYTTPASEESVRVVLAADTESGDGRSEWLWIRLANGNLILGVYPQGETYFDTEEDHSK